MERRADKVGDVMSRHPAAIRTGTDLTEVVDTLLRLKVTGLPVIDDSERVVGFISEQDCLRSLIVSAYHCEGAPTVDSLMATRVLSVRPDDSLVDVAELMVRERPKVYPVVDEDERLIGMLSRGQVLKALKALRLACDSI